MWQTCTGERVLRGAERELFRAALAGVWQLVEDDIFSTGIIAFDELPRGQRLRMLALIGSALQDEAVPPPGLTATAEAAVGAVFDYIHQAVQLELRSGGRRWRALILAAWQETGDFRYAPVLDLACDVPAYWSDVVEALTQALLPNHQSAEVNPFGRLDSDPTHPLLRLYGDDLADCLSSLDDPSDHELDDIRRTLADVTGPAESVAPPGIKDGYYCLRVGPCDPDTISREVAACRLVEEFSADDADFDCTYDEWLTLFREDVHRAAEEPSPHLDPRTILTPDELAAAELVQGIEGRLVVEDGHAIDPHQGGWVVIDQHGYYLFDVEGCGWVADGVHPELRPLVFPTAALAFAALVRSENIVRARAERYGEAMKRLGRESEPYLSEPDA